MGIAPNLHMWYPVSSTNAFVNDYSWNAIMPGHIVLLGDSIFDNARYVPGGPSVIEHLRRILPGGWRATLLARDGSVTADVARQLAAVPEDATHLVISAGGNDALEQGSVILHDPARSFA